MKKATKKGLLATGFAAVVIGACGDTVEVVTPPFPDIPPITIPPPVVPPPEAEAEAEVAEVAA
ncbi:MAG: hypothetical protein F4X22_09460, partial [Gemmatimonadales bacterium]|nr:hypothetical protein [Candidatus Palauibacter denitrificans]